MIPLVWEGHPSSSARYKRRNQVSFRSVCRSRFHPVFIQPIDEEVLSRVVDTGLRYVILKYFTVRIIFLKK